MSRLKPKPSRSPDNSVVPRRVRQASEWSWRLIVIAVAIYLALHGLSVVSQIVIPVIVAALLAALFGPWTQRLTRVMPRSAASGLTIIGLVVLVAGVLFIVGRQFSDGFSDISTQLLDGIQTIRNWVSSTFGISDAQLTEYLERVRESISSDGGGLGAVAAKAGLTVTHVLTGLFIALFALFFFLYQGRDIWEWIVRLFPRRSRDLVRESGDIAWGQLSAFTNATVIVAAVDAIGIGLGAALLKVPFAPAVALLVFFGAFIPIVGALASGSVPVLLALVAHGPIRALAMLGVVVTVQQLESHILQPFLLGRAVRLHPLAVILGIATGIILAGIIGGLIAVPVMAVANAVGKHLLANDSPDPGPGPLDDGEAEIQPV